MANEVPHAGSSPSRSSPRRALRSSPAITPLALGQSSPSKQPPRASVQSRYMSLWCFFLLSLSSPGHTRLSFSRSCLDPRPQRWVIIRSLSTLAFARLGTTDAEACYWGFVPFVSRKGFGNRRSWDGVVRRCVASRLLTQGQGLG